MVIEEEWFYDMILTDGATFPTALIKRAKYIFSQKIKFPRNTKQRIWEISINNGWKTHIVQIFHEKRNGNFLFKGNFLSRLPKFVGLSHEWINNNFNYQET